MNPFRGKIVYARLFATIAVSTLVATGAYAEENTENMQAIGASAYFESLGWVFATPENSGGWAGGDATALSNLGGGATVAILDGLADERHEDLSYDPNSAGPNYPNSTVFIFSGFPFNPSYKYWSNHGTHVSGIIGAGLNGFGVSGVAPEARLLNFAVFDDNGWVGADEEQVLGFAIDHGASVANMSYGPTALGDFSSSTTLSAIDAHKNSIVVVKAAGNDGLNLVDENFRSKGKPLTNLIIVGSVNTDNEIALYSNTPGDACIVSKGRCVVPLKDMFMVAPGGNAKSGEGILSTVPSSNNPSDGYGVMTGTSMAAPHVAGAVALLHGRWNFLKREPETTRAILFDSATDLAVVTEENPDGDPDGVDGVYGHGLLNVYAAMYPSNNVTEFYVASGLNYIEDTGTEEPPVEDEPTGNNGRGGGKKSKAIEWRLGETQMMGSRSLAALGQTDATVSMFDKYRRDFPIYLSSLVRPIRSELSDKLERMVAPSYVAYEDTLDRVDNNEFFYMMLNGGEAIDYDRAHNVMLSFNLTRGSDVQAQIFTGTGEAQSLFYTPAVSVGGLANNKAEISGVNPILGFASGENFSGLAIDQLGRWRFAFGYTQNQEEQVRYNDYDADALAVSLGYQLTQSQNLNVTVTRLSEDGGMLGTKSGGAFDMGSNNRSDAVTTSWDMRSANGFSMTASYTMSSTEGNGDGILQFDDQIVSDAFHLGIAKSKVLFGNDRLALSVSQPLRVRKGAVFIDANLGLDARGIMQMQHEVLPLEPTGREIDVQLEHGLPLGHLTSLTTFAYFAIDSGHIQGRQEAGLAMRLQKRF